MSYSGQMIGKVLRVKSIRHVCDDSTTSMEFKSPTKKSVYVVMVLGLEPQRVDGKVPSTADEYLNRIGWVFDPKRAKAVKEPDDG